MAFDKRVDILGVLSDLGGANNGSWIGPDAVREAGLFDELRSLGVAVDHRGDMRGKRKDEADVGNPLLKYGHTILEQCKEIKSRLLAGYQAGNFPITFGGDHSLALGTLSAFLTAFEPSEAGVLWVDAHGDINTPNTTPSGNIHGMALGVGVGLTFDPGHPAPKSRMEREPAVDLKGAAQLWTQLQALFGGRFLRKSNLFWVGLRNLDEGEKATILGLPGVPARTMTDVDRRGIAQCIADALTHLREAGVRNLHLSFDVDVIDPTIAPGTGTTVLGGLTYREAHLVAEMIHEACVWEKGPGPRLASMDIVEVQPITDEHNRTARLAVELASSVLGKRILPLVE